MIGWYSRKNSWVASARARSASRGRQGIGGARGRQPRVRHRLQQPVAGIVPQGVVDVLEVVEVEEQDREAAQAALRQSERVLHAVAEQVAVRKQCQRVVEGEL